MRLTPTRHRALAIALPAALALTSLLPISAGAGTQTAPAAGAAPRAPRGTSAHGREIFDSAGCALCHAATFAQEEKEGLLRAGHPLEGAPGRGTWWQGKIVTDAGDASEICLKTWIAPEAGGFAADERKALILFMQSLGGERGIGPLQILRRDAGDVDLKAGDPARGRRVYDAACLACHPGDSGSLRALGGKLSPAQVATVVRRGTGTMPFFQVDRLSALQVADVAAFLEAAAGAHGTP